ncbi:MAG: hypothetical protein RMK01_08855 [Thermomicrobium sp.]|nr:hypothetical protein [Thermomicrobium sp.]
MASDAFLHAGSRRKVAVAGLVSGVVAGIVFAMFEMIVAALQGMGFVPPLRMIAAIVLGEKTMDASFSLASAIAAGAIVHMILSAVYGWFLPCWSPRGRSSRSRFRW